MDSQEANDIKDIGDCEIVYFESDSLNKNEIIEYYNGDC